MKIGLVGYQGSGKSTLFEWLTGIKPDPSQAHVGQSAMATVPEPRIETLAKIYHPKKITQAVLEIVDTPGLSRTHEGNAARLAIIREAGCLVLVVAAFGNANSAADLRSFEEDFLLADMELVGNRLHRVAESLKKPLPKQEHDHLVHEQATLQMVLAALEAGKPLRESDMTEEQAKVTRAFRLLSEKPRMVVVNTADDEAHPERFAEAIREETERKMGDRKTEPAGKAGEVPVPVIPVVAGPIGLELELSRMSPEDRAEFETELGANRVDRDQLIHTMMQVSGQRLFLTAGDKEVRSWMLRQGGTALEAAAGIHTDLARGFIRAEVMTCSDLDRLGSEREVKANHLMRQEPKDYVIQEDDVIFIRFSV